MSVVSLQCLVGSSVVAPIEDSPAGEDLTINIAAFSAPGVPADLTGLYVVLHWTADPSGVELSVPAAGGVGGLASFTFPAVITSTWHSGWFRFYVTLSGVGAPLAPLVSTSFVQVTGVPALPPSQQTIQVAGVVDLGFGGAITIPASPHWVTPVGGTMGLRSVCSVPAGTLRDASAVAEVRIGRFVGTTWTPVTSIPLTQTAVDWSFEGFATTANQLALPVGTYQYQVWVVAAAGTFLTADTGALDIIASAGTAAPTPPPVVLSRVYYGVAAAGLTGTSAIEAALSHADVAATSDFSRELSPAGQSVYVAYPATLGSPQWTNDGFAVGELAPRTVSLHDVSAGLASYTLRETRFLQTGTDLQFIVEFSHA